MTPSHPSRRARSGSSSLTSSTRRIGAVSGSDFSNARAILGVQVRHFLAVEPEDIKTW